MRLVIVLHAHLPFIRHPEHPRFFEEDWLYEAIFEVYLPLIEVLEGWERDGISGQLVLSLSPPLVASLDDTLLQSRFRAYLDRKGALLREESLRLSQEAPHLLPGLLHLSQRMREMRQLYERWGGDILGAFRALAERGLLHLGTSAATHAFLPAFSSFPRFIQTQINLAVDQHSDRFGMPARFFWLPECGWFDGADAFLRRARLGATVLEDRALTHAYPPLSLRQLALTQTDLLILPRDPVLAERVWSANVGYPGDPRYLDFYSDETWGLSEGVVGPHLLPDGARIPMGLRYRRVTDRTLPAPRKAPYQPREARIATSEHARDFLDACATSEAKVLVAPFDAELFGHWWHEGPGFLDRVGRLAQGRVRLVTPDDLLDEGLVLPVVRPSESTWGEGSDARVWIGEKTAAVWPRLLAAAARLERQKAPQTEREAMVRAQQIRELFLAASSDWTFLMAQGTATAYARDRLESHLNRLDTLEEALKSGAPDLEGMVRAFESETPLFPRVLETWFEREPNE